MASDRDDPFYIDPGIWKAARSLSLEARGMLVTLIMHAALTEGKTLAVDDKFLRSLSTHARDKRSALKRFEEIVAAGFARRVESGAFLIAPEWWKFETEMDDKDDTTTS
jgi:hypothetical protein